VIKNNGKKQARQHVAAIELTRDALTLLVPTQDAGCYQPGVRARKIVWRREASDLLSTIGRRELSEAFVKLASEEKLQGVQLYLTLGSEFCVTRVVAGENDIVKREVQELIQRSRGYLSLGVGEKVVAVSEEAMDARRRYVWVSVANKQVLQAIDDAVLAARLQLMHIEHSVVSVSRVVQRSGVDAEAPVILVDIADSGVDVALCYRGQLLLDYRPSGTNAKESVAVIIDRHTKRLQRYADRLLRNSSRPIRGVCISGDATDVARVAQQLDQTGGKEHLEHHVLSPGSVAEGWALHESFKTDSCSTGAFGLLIHKMDQREGDRYPNLLDSLRGSRRLPVGRTLLQIGWPVAATIVAALVVALLGYVREAEADQLAMRLDTLFPEMAEVSRLEELALSARVKATHLESLAKHSVIPNWSSILDDVGRSMPRGVWMSQFTVDGAGVVVISGTSHSEEGVFEFVKYLKRVPDMWSVSLEGTQATFLPTGPAVSFTLRGAILDRASVTDGGLPVSSWHPAPGPIETVHRMARDGGARNGSRRLQ